MGYLGARKGTTSEQKSQRDVYYAWLERTGNSSRFLNVLGHT